MIFLKKEMILDAKEFSKEKIDDYNEGSLWEHTLLVLKISLKLADRIKGTNKEAVSIGCYLHDIGIPEDKDNHPLLAKQYAESFFENRIVSEPFKQIVFDIILNHGTLGVPKTKEGKIVSSADKMSIFDDKNILKMVYQASKKIDSFKELSTYFLAKFDKKFKAIPLDLGKQMIVKKYKQSKSVFSVE